MAAPVLLAQMSKAELAEADGRYPKWATMCQLRRLGLPVLNAVLLTPGQDDHDLEAAVTAMARATGKDALLVRSDGGIETRRYYKGGNTFPLAQAASKAAGLLEAGRAVLLMEPTNRFTNRLTALIRMDRPAPRRAGTFTIEGLGPGYDVGDLTRGGITPQVTVTAEVDWSHYRELWFSDLRLTSNLDPAAEHDRRQRRLARLAVDVLADTGHLDATLTIDERAAAAETWLRERGYEQLWQSYDVAAAIALRARRWFDDAFLIATCHPGRAWTCRATATSDIGGRWVFWDIVDGHHKYAASGRVK
ncbi:hypothetical protein ACQP25_44770 (plasmid) [Microtetraspora malaysiensis]|uniref:hypothetical protein n=1 Tax=Microtetraspora malaysiensis TaxID=161358 RepID=UPI003D8CD76D